MNNLLRRLPLFEDLAEEDLGRLYQMTEPVTVNACQVLLSEGSPADAVYIVLDGRLQLIKRSGSQEVLLADCGEGDVIGEVSLLEPASQSATVRALVDSRVLKISQDAFQRLLTTSPSAAFVVLRTAMARLRHTEGLLMQHEKLAALGTLSAGLAHELNNPASAVMRSTDQLQVTLSGWQKAALALQGSQPSSELRERIHDLAREIERRAGEPVDLGTIERSDREEGVRVWLEGYGVENAWEDAPALVSLGWDSPQLRALSQPFTEEQRPALARWLGASAQLFSIMHGIVVGAERIAQVVYAVKVYTHLDDKAAFAPVDVHASLENALIILAHKLRGGVALHRHYDESLPLIDGSAGELSQAWTNIIDNAIDAMNGQGELYLRTEARDGQALVEICDSGPGIPAEQQSRVFDPFYTTKEPGYGTGLGLHLVYKILVLRHGGKISIASHPGQTCFSVTLPVKPGQPG